MVFYIEKHFFQAFRIFLWSKESEKEVKMLLRKIRKMPYLAVTF